MPNQTPRDESLPRQSDLFKFLYAEDFDSIPEDILHNKACEGVEKHNLLETTYGVATENLIVRMFREGLNRIFSPTELCVAPTFEEQLNGSRFTGKPDFVLGLTMLDYKFCLDLRNVTALQLVAYAILIKELKGISIERFFGFHFPDDHSLFIHRIPERTVPVLVEFVNFVIDNHAAIEAGELVKYDAISRWEVIQRDYDVFEMVEVVLPPMMITSTEDAIQAVGTYHRIKDILDREKLLSREIQRYMEARNLTKIEDANGFGVRIELRNNKTYDPVKKAEADAIHKAAKVECLTGTVPSSFIKRFSPRKKKPTQLN